MARKRMIDPDFWTDEKIVQLPFEARLLFIGLWNVADDSGLLWDEPERIRLVVLPNDPVDIDDLLDLLMAAGLIERSFTSAGRGFISIPHFLEHQKISHPAESRIPTEGARKVVIPPAVRRAVATKYGCAAGETRDVQCYYCGAAGRIHWHRLYSGKPSAWVSFSGVELDHFESESDGGATSPENIVLACRECNRSKQAGEPMAFVASRSGVVANPPESSGDIPSNVIQVKTKESKTTESEGKRARAKSNAPDGATRPHPLMDRLIDLDVVKPSLTTSHQWKQHWLAVEEFERLGLTVEQLDTAVFEARQRVARWRGPSPPPLTPGYLARNLSDFFTPPPEAVPRVEDIRNPRIKAALTADLDDIDAEIEARDAESNRLPGEVDHARLSADARRLGPGRNGAIPHVLPHVAGRQAGGI